MKNNEDNYLQIFIDIFEKIRDEYDIKYILVEDNTIKFFTENDRSYYITINRKSKIEDVLEELK